MLEAWGGGVPHHDFLQDPRHIEGFKDKSLASESSCKVCWHIVGSCHELLQRAQPLIGSVHTSTAKFKVKISKP